MFSPKSDDASVNETDRKPITSLQLLQDYDNSSDSDDETDDQKLNIANSNTIENKSVIGVADANLSNVGNKTDNAKTMWNNENYPASQGFGASFSDSVEPMDSNEDSSVLVLKNNAINANCHGPLAASHMSASEGLENVSNAQIESDETIKSSAFEIKQSEQESHSNSDSDTSSDSESDSSSEWESLKGVGDSDSDENTSKGAICNKTNSVKVKGELALEDLPPIEDLTISVPQQECQVVGTIYDIVDQLVIVQSYPSKPALDIDTVLFLDEGARPLGQIFDVFGQVVEPFYCVRFNSKDHIKGKGIDVGMCVYCAPRTEHTHLVFVSELMRLKGSDASWKDDIEPPPKFLEFSDDEEERNAKKKQKKKKINLTTVDEGETSGNIKRPKPTQFEERMNRKNLQKTEESNKRFRPQQNQNFSRKNTNPFGRRNNFSPVNNDTNLDIQWGPSTTYFMGGNHFEMGQHRPRMNVPFGGYPPNLCGPPPPFMRPPRFMAPVPPFVSQRPPWFMTPPPPSSAPPGT